MSYIGSALDCHMSDEEYIAYENFVKDTFWCILCEAPHFRIDGKLHSRCQINDCPDCPEDWEEI